MTTLILATADLRAEQLTDVEHRRFPRVDYLELQKVLDADVVNYSVYANQPAGRLFRHLETQIHSDLYLTGMGFAARNRYDSIFAMSERAGIPYAFLRAIGGGRGAFVTMFQSWSWRQEAAISRLRLIPRMDAIIVHCDSMREKFLALGATPEQVHVIRYSVDQHFFAPQSSPPQEDNFILSLGEIRSRDYATLFQACAGLPLQLLVAASGHWYAREKQTSLGVQVPENTVLASRLPHRELRDLYSRAAFVVLPVYGSVYSAGATAILEAMCMERAVIATRSAGLQDYLIHGETGIFVEPANPDAMRSAIEFLLAHPEEARRMGRNGRRRIEGELNLERYVADMARLLRQMA